MRLVGAVGIGLKATLKARKLLIPLNAKYAKNSEFAQVRYTPGTRRDSNIHVPLWPSTSVGFATPHDGYPAGSDAVERMQDFLRGLVEAGIARRTTVSFPLDFGI